MYKFLAHFCVGPVKPRAIRFLYVFLIEIIGNLRFNANDTTASDKDMKYKKHQINQPEKDRLIERIRSYLISEHPEIIAVYLFGSFTEEGSFSDIDIGILLKQPTEKPLELEFKIESNIEKIAILPVDVRILNNAPLSFCFTVIRGKRLIIDRDSDFRADFENYTLKKYFDFAPFRRRYLAEVENAQV